MKHDASHGGRPPKSSADDLLAHKLHRLSRLTFRARHHQPQGSATAVLGFDPQRGQGRILRLLYLQDGVAQRDIAYTLDIRPQSLGEVLNKLEANGYVRREVDELDHRVQLVFLTEEGRAIAAQLNAPQERRRVDMFAVLEDDEREQLGRTLDKLIDHLVAEIGEDPDPPRRGTGRGPGGPDRPDRQGGPVDSPHGPQGFPPPPPRW